MPFDKLFPGDCLTVLKSLKPDSVDLICTDPPYGIGFRSCRWDIFAAAQPPPPRATKGSAQTRPVAARRSPQFSFKEFMRATGAACLRVLKPGGLMFIAMTPRQDSLAHAIVGLEEAGFNVGFTSLYWTFATGFPKAANVARMVDARFGAKRKIIGTQKQHDMRGGKCGSSKAAFQRTLTSGPVTAEAKTLDGAYAGFQPKPAVEVILVAMKPLCEKSYLDQAMANGKGITWLDDARIPADEAISIHHAPSGSFAGGKPNRGSIKNYHTQNKGRFPANLIVSDDVLGCHSGFFSLDAWVSGPRNQTRQSLPFFIVPKARKGEKPLIGHGDAHPTVKPLKLMAYLITLGSRPGDVVLDPFLGSGTTAVAARILGRHYIGIERERAYLRVARRRLACL